MRHLSFVPMKWQLYALVAFAGAAATGGLASTLLRQTMVDALNHRRPANHQIPRTFSGAKDVRWLFLTPPLIGWFLKNSSVNSHKVERISGTSPSWFPWFARFVVAALAMISRDGLP